MMIKKLPEDYTEVFRLLNIQLTNITHGSAYNWVRPSIWSTVFGNLYAQPIKKEMKTK